MAAHERVYFDVARSEARFAEAQDGRHAMMTRAALSRAIVAARRAHEA